MPHSVTITAKTGPGVQNTAIVYPDVKAVNFDFVMNSVQIQVAQGVGDNIKEYELVGVTALADTITAGVHAFVIS